MNPFHDLHLVCFRCSQTRRLMYTRTWERHSFCQLRALFHPICLHFHPCYSSCHLDGISIGRVLVGCGESLLLQDVQRSHSKCNKCKLFASIWKKKNIKTSVYLSFTAIQSFRQVMSYLPCHILAYISQKLAIVFLTLFQTSLKGSAFNSLFLWYTKSKTLLR